MHTSSLRSQETTPGQAISVRFSGPKDFHTSDVWTVGNFWCTSLLGLGTSYLMSKFALKLGAYRDLHKPGDCAPRGAEFV